MLSKLSVCAVVVWLAAVVVAAAPASVWLDVPFVAQEKNACGAASIAMVMQYWAREQGQPAGLDADAAAIQRALYSEPADGIFASAMQAYFEKHGFRSFVFSGDKQDLEQHLAKGRPLIVALGTSKSSQLHYVVVAGLDASAGTVLLNDPARRKLLKQNWQEFERQWGVTNHWTLLAVPQ